MRPTEGKTARGQISALPPNQQCRACVQRRRLDWGGKGDAARLPRKGTNRVGLWEHVDMGEGTR